MNIPSSFRHHLLLGLAAAAMLTGAMAASAAAIDVTSSASMLTIGQGVDVNFNISGLSHAPGHSMSAFELDVLFDPAVLQLAGFAFSDGASGLNQLDFAESTSFGFLGAATASGGAIAAFGLSGNSAAVLDSAQSDAFRFLRLRFASVTASAATSVAINTADPALLFADSDANRLPVDLRMPQVTLAVVSAAAIPEPGSLLLLLIGMMAWAICVRSSDAGKFPDRVASTAATAAMLLASVAAPASTAAQPTERGPAISRPSAATPPPTPQAQSGNVNGVIIAVQGQRALVRQDNGTPRWYSIRAPLTPASVGKRISGSAVPRGDAIVLDTPHITD